MKYLITVSAFALIISSCNQSSNNKKESQQSSDTTANAAAKLPLSNPEKNCYFGDLHLHTALSADANLFGATLLPDDSYRFAMGEEVTYMGQKVKRIAPLDFLAVTDHAEYLGVIRE